MFRRAVSDRNLNFAVVSALAALVALALLVLAGPAAAAGKRKAERPWNNPNRAVEYVGKTASGHEIEFTFKKNALWDMASGISVSCIPIQGSGPPSGGVELFDYSGYVALNPKGEDFEFMKKVSVYYNEVTVKHTLATSINRKNGTIRGTQRMQFSYFLPQFPMPKFAIYSCLAEGSFVAKPVLDGGAKGGRR